MWGCHAGEWGGVVLWPWWVMGTGERRRRRWGYKSPIHTYSCQRRSGGRRAPASTVTLSWKRHTNTKIRVAMGKQRSSQCRKQRHTYTRVEVVTPPLSIRNSINIPVQRREVSMCLHGLDFPFLSPSHPRDSPSFWEISFLPILLSAQL